MDEQNEDLRVLSVFHRVISWLAVIFGSIPPVFILLVGWIRRDFEQYRAAPEIVGSRETVVLLTIGGLLWGYAVLLRVAGQFITRRRHRGFILAVNVASLLFLPFGTVVGLLTFTALAKPENRALFKDA